jgi:hypothetical protein
MCKLSVGDTGRRVGTPGRLDDGRGRLDKGLIFLDGLDVGSGEFVVMVSLILAIDEKPVQ